MTDGSGESVQVDVQFACRQDSVPAEADIESWIRSAISEAEVSEPVEVSVRIVDEAEGRSLNERFRDRDYATNVLSFPSGDAAWPAGVPRPLGDIVICGPVVQRESVEQGKAAADHWAHIIVHGALHLLGFDHEVDADASKMEALETRILASRGVGDPYAA
jgi:probable rRNA maturation factor